jgi:hypothetical protein
MKHPHYSSYLKDISSSEHHKLPAAAALQVSKGISEAHITLFWIGAALT